MKKLRVTLNDQGDGDGGVIGQWESINQGFLAANMRVTMQASSVERILLTLR